MNKLKLQETQAEKGFTLIELSIVLVIIGLIVGGVLVGQDLIKAAEIRATVGQIEKYNSAVNTFRTKFNCIPGDCLETQAKAFGLYDSGATTTGLGDGNGLITDTAATNINGAVGETVMFWRHLSDASLVDGSLGQQLGAAGVLGSSPAVAQYLPAAKMGRGNYIVAGSDSGTNYYVISGVSALGTSGGVNTYTPAMTPIEAYNIDIKVDDGLPNTGIVQARGTANASDGPWAPNSTSTYASYGSSSASGDCMVDASSQMTDPAATYNRSLTAGGTTMACMVRYRFN